MSDNYTENYEGLLFLPATDAFFLHGIKKLTDKELADMRATLNARQPNERNHLGRIAAVAKELRLRKKEVSVSGQSRKADSPERSGAVMINGKQFLGVRDVKKLAAIFAGIAGDEKAAVKLLAKTARAYYDAGNILAAAVHNWNNKAGRLAAKAVAEASGFPERRIVIALKIFKQFENNPGALDSIDLRDTLKLIAPPPPSGEEGYNRIDLGGDPGQMEFDFDKLFKLPSTGNQSLQNYRTVGDQITEILVVHRGEGGLLTSRRFAHFCEDVPQNPALRHAYRAMSQKTQAAIEDYLAALEQEEAF